MLQGEFTSQMDTKGRICIPASLRDSLQAQYGEQAFVLSRDYRDPCLRAYPLEEWQQLQQRLSQQANENTVVRAFKRIVVGAAQALNPDRQGRILIPQQLRQYAQLQKNILFCGTSESFEIWDQQTWNEQFQQALNILQQTDDLGF